MPILHTLDHSLPLHSGYTFRSATILREQRRLLGWQPFHLTEAKQGAVSALEENADGLHFFRTPVEKAALAHWPVLNQAEIFQGLVAATDCSSNDRISP